MLYLAVAIAGGFGAVARLSINAAISASAFPWATMVCNVIGSGLIGVLFVLREKGILLGGELTHAALMIGFLGAFTTFSAFSLQSLELMLNQMSGLAALNIIGNVTLCLLSVFVGFRLTTLFFGM